MTSRELLSTQRNAVAFVSKSGLPWQPGYNGPRFNYPPGPNDWDRIKPVFARLYYEERNSLEETRRELESIGFRATTKMFKDHITAWGLDKNLKLREVEKILWIQNQNPRLNIKFFIRGQPVEMDRVENYQRRSGLRTSDVISRIQLGAVPRCPDVTFSILSLRPALAPANDLGKFTDLVREVEDILRVSASSGLCYPGFTRLHWISSNSNVETKTQHFKSIIWQGIKYHMEELYSAAVLCWKDALLLFEELYAQPNLDTWTTVFITFVELHRREMFKVISLFLEKLKGLEEFVPFRQSYQAFAKFLLVIDLRALPEAALLFLEIKLKLVQNMWPDNEKTSLVYQLELAEARLCQGYTVDEAGLPIVDVPRSSSRGDLYVQAEILSCRILRLLLLQDFARVETESEGYIEYLKNRGLNGYETLLATFYGILARAQFYQFKDKAAMQNYAVTLRLARPSKHNPVNQSASAFAEKHRTLYILDWLSNAHRSAIADGNPEWRAQQSTLEAEWQRVLDAQMRSKLTTKRFPVNTQFVQCFSNGERNSHISLLHKSTRHFDSVSSFRPSCFETARTIMCPAFLIDTPRSYTTGAGHSGGGGQGTADRFVDREFGPRPLIPFR